MRFTVTNKEPVRLLLNATKAPDFGIYQASLNGVKLGDPLDFYDPRLSTRSVICWIFGRTRANTHCAWNARARTRPPAAMHCGVESLRLRGRRPRVAAMAHDKDKDWRKDPKLYND